MRDGAILAFAAACSMALPAPTIAADGHVLWSPVCGDPDKRIAIPVRGQPHENHASKACHACTWKNAGVKIVRGGEGARV